MGGNVSDIAVKAHIQSPHAVGVLLSDEAEQMGVIRQSSGVFLIGITQDEAVSHAVADKPRVGGRIGKLLSASSVP